MLNTLLSCQEEDLVAELKSDNEAALTSIYYRFHSRLFNNANRVLQDKEVSEEIVQDVFFELWDKRERIEIRVSLHSYLYAMTRYMVFRYIRNEKSRMHFFEQLAQKHAFENYLCLTPETFLIEKELNERIVVLTQNLPPRCRQIYQLSRQEQLSHKEISSRLQISTKTVENQITKALKVFNRLRN